MIRSAVAETGGVGVLAAVTHAAHWFAASRSVSDPLWFEEEVPVDERNDGDPSEERCETRHPLRGGAIDSESPGIPSR